MAAISEKGFDLSRFDESYFYPKAEVLAKTLEVHPARDEILAYLALHRVPEKILYLWPERKGAVLSDLGILRHLLAGNITIYPFTARQLGPNSYNVILKKDFHRAREKGDLPRLNSPAKTEVSSYVVPQQSSWIEEGKRLMSNLDKETKPLKPKIDTYNPFDYENVTFVWQYEEAVSASLIQSANNLDFVGIKPQDHIILLYPHEMILASTEEFIGGENVVATKISGRSTTGRNLIEVCSDADFGNIGWINRWTLEIVNKSARFAIPLVAGQSYAQITFFEATPTAQSYSGLYQNGKTLRSVIDEWNPEMRLPKMKRL